MKLKVFCILIILVPHLLLAQQSQKEPNFELKVDPKIELLTILMNYSYWDYFGKFKTTEYKYYNNMKAHFDKFSKHPSIEWYNEASQNWNFDDPASVILWYDSLPLKQVVPFPLHSTSQIDTIVVKEFIEKLNQFAEDTDFKSFWKKNNPWHDSIIQDLKHSENYTNYLGQMESFYGEKKDKYVFILSPLFNGISFGPQVKNKEHTTAYFITGFDGMENGIPYFNNDDLKMLIFHEYGHSFVNPVCEENRAELYKYEHLSEYFNSPFLSNYASWFAFCHEHIVRTCESILLKKAGYKKYAQENSKRNLRLGFTLLPLLKEKMEYYDSNRDKYESFKEFFPELLIVFAETEPIKAEQPKPLGLYFKATDTGICLDYISGRSPFKDSLQVNDIITSINKHAIQSEDDISIFKDIYYDSNKNDVIQLGILRNGIKYDLEIEVPFQNSYLFNKKSK